MNFFDALLEPFEFLVNPGKRLFFVYLLSSCVLAFLVLWLQEKNIAKTWKMLTNPRVWKHPSTQTDIKLLLFNSLLKSVLFFFVVVSSVSLANALVKLLYQIFPDHLPFKLSYLVVVGLFSVVSFIALDFSRFFQHYLFHKVPWLWRFHKVHHSAIVLTPLTLYRTHPVESLISALRRIIVVGLVSGLFIFYTRSMLSAWAILGVNIFDFLFNLFGSNLRHSHVWLSFGPLNYFFISPAQHQIHHSRAFKHRDKNLGVALALWDQLFGTFYQVQKKEFLIFGVRGERHRGLGEALKAPLKN